MEQLGLFPDVTLRAAEPPVPRIRPRASAERLPMGGWETILDGLTEEQAQAVTHGTGPLLVVAGAGTGKTSVLTRRIAYLVAAGLARPSEILALTFTDKAAREMQERVDMLLPYGYADVTIATFHSFGDRVLRSGALELGLNPEFQVLSSAEQVLFLRDRMFELPLHRYRPLGHPTGHLQALAAHFGKAKDEGVTPRRYQDWVDSLDRATDEDEDRFQSQHELARVYAAYQTMMLEAGCLDFADLVFRSLELLRSRPAALQALRQRYRYLLVDEFQDTNRTQFELVRLLAGEEANLTAVGDDDQAIYGFRGAAVGNILEFSEVYPQTAQVVLRSNFRSVQPILDAAYRLIGHNNPDRLEVRCGLDKRLTSHKEGAGHLAHRHFETVSEEAEAIAEEIANSPRPKSDFAILVRVNRDADPYLRALNGRGIPYRFTGSQGLYSRPEIRLATSFLRCLCDPHDSLSAFFLAASELYRFPPDALMLLNSQAQRRHVPLLKVLAEPGDEVTLSEEAGATCAKLLEDLARYTRLIPDESPGRILYHFLTESGWLRLLSSGDTPDGDARLQNLARFFETLKAYEELHPQALLPQFMAHLDLLIEAGDSPGVVEAEASEDAVEVLTVHKSKGLEFPVVFLVGLVEGRFPGGARPDLLEFPVELLSCPPGDEQLVAEERRLFYVGMTRAKEELWLTSARDGGGRSARRPSRFVLEALDRPSQTSANAALTSLEKVQRFAPVEPAREAGWAPMAPHRLLTLSFRQVDDYLTCPLKYKFVHVLRVPITPHHAVIYGNALHEAVSAYLLKRQEGGTLTLEELWEHFHKAWSSQGFLTRAHEEQRYEAGRQALQRFWEAEEGRSRVPLLVEQEFAFSLGNNKVVGRWDRVDEEAGQTVLTDYKSSEVRTQEAADRRAAESLQLSLYCLAYKECRLKIPGEVRLHFLDSGLVGRAPVGGERLRVAREKVLEAADGIRERDYGARPTFGACKSCAYREICPATAT